MSIVSIGELLDRFSNFEDKLESYYAGLRDTTENSGVRLLTYYLSKHRQHLKEVERGFSSSDFNKLSQVELKYDLEFNVERDFHVINRPLKEITGEELLKAAADYDEKLIHWYEKILLQPIGKDGMILFQSLLNREKRDIVMLKKMLAMNYF